MGALAAWRLTGTPTWLAAVVVASILGLGVAAYSGAWGLIFLGRFLFGHGAWAENLFAGIGAVVWSGILAVTVMLMDAVTWLRWKIRRLAREQLLQARYRVSTSP
jgi:hypothetical protein